MNKLHPGVQILKDEISVSKHHYDDIASSTGISVNRLKNLMSGRREMTMKERDILCDCLDISPIDVVMRREDLQERKEFLDLRELPETMKTSLIILHNEVSLLYKKIK